MLRKPRGLLWLAIPVLCAGCAAHPPREVVPAAAPNRIEVAIDDTFPALRATAIEVSQRRLGKAGLSFEPVGTTPGLRIGLRLAYRNLTDTEFEVAWRATTFLLATLYPSTCRHRSYTLTAELTDAVGNARSYEATDSTVAWVWLLSGPRCGETPSAEEIRSVARRLLDRLYDQMSRDAAFPGGLTAAPTTAAPLVHVSANRARELTEQVLRVDRPLARWTFMENEAVPDYRVNLYFDVRPGTFSIGRAYLAIMTGGLAGVCRATPITLLATITSPTAPRTRAYLATQSVRGHVKGSGPDCEVQDETTRPEAFAALLREVLGKATRDGLIPTSRQPPAAATLPPWVRVIAGRAEGIVRQETIRQGLLPRYLFGDATEYPPGYTLRIDFDFQGGGRKPLSTAGEVGAGLGVAWLGKNVTCEPTTMVLTAVLTDGGHAEVARYQITRVVKFSGSLGAVDCRDDETTNPQAVQALVSSLYARMTADGRLALLRQPVP